MMNIRHTVTFEPAKPNVRSLSAIVKSFMEDNEDATPAEVWAFLRGRYTAGFPFTLILIEGTLPTTLVSNSNLVVMGTSPEIAGNYIEVQAQEHS